MKVRIVNNSIRFRLKEPEVHQFAEEGKITEVVEFGSEVEDKLCFCLEISNDASLKISYKSNITTIYVPKGLAEKWTKTGMVGFDGKIETGKGRTIQLLVEKDFMCLDGREDDNAGSYPNPLAEMKNSGS